jgi:hypothetical protein
VEAADVRAPGEYKPHPPKTMVIRLDTALHITVLHHGFYVGAISIWGGLARPGGRRASKHDQMFIELNSLGLNWVYAPISLAHGIGLLELLGNPNNTSL